MRIEDRIGVMPGPFFWQFVSLCEKSEIDSVWFSERLSPTRTQRSRLRCRGSMGPVL
jgi:hypothetical protein